MEVQNRVIKIYRLSSFLCEWMCREQIINEDELELSETGLQITKANMIKFVIMSVIGFLFGSIWEMLLFYAVFVSLRVYCGGYHADSYGKCFCMFALTCVAAMFGIKTIMFQRVTQAAVLAAVALVQFFCIYKWAPIEHVNRPATTEEKRRFRTKGLWIFAFWFMLGIGLWYQQQYSFAASVISGFLLVSIYMLVKKGENSCEKDRT